MLKLTKHSNKLLQQKGKLAPILSRAASTEKTPISRPSGAFRSTKADYDVVIVGGGTGGMTVAWQLLNKDKTLNIGLFEPSEIHHYQPSWTMVGGGLYSFRNNNTARKTEELLPRGVTWHESHVVDLDPESNTIGLPSGKRYSYHNLVVAAGLQINWDQVDGLLEALEAPVKESGVASNYSWRYCERTLPATENCPVGANAIFTAPNTPIKCGGAPLKALFLSHWGRGILSEIKKSQELVANYKFFTGMPAIFPSPYYADPLKKHLAERQVEVKTQHNLVKVQPKQKIATFKDLQTGKEVEMEYGMLHAVPPMSSPDFVKSSPLANAAGFVDVDQGTLRHVKYGNVYAIGDVSSLPTSKTAAAVAAQAPILVDQLLNPNTSTKTYNGYTSCPLYITPTHIIPAEFGYGGTPMPKFTLSNNSKTYDSREPNRYAAIGKKYLLPYIYWNYLVQWGLWNPSRFEGKDLGEIAGEMVTMSLEKLRTMRNWRNDPPAEATKP